MTIDGFDDLADIIASYPEFRETHFVFVPGPLDLCGSTVFPRPSILPSLVGRIKAKVPKAHFMSNPCRIKVFAQEIVIFREDMMAKMLRNLITHKQGVSDADLKKYVRAIQPPSSYGRSCLITSQLFQTILDQCHLSPLPQTVQPILPEFDHTLRLYPLPTTVMITIRPLRCF